MKPYADAPALSVVVVPFAGPRYLERCLAALAPQISATGAEVLVPCDDTLTGVAELERSRPELRFIRVRGRRTPAELRALGVRSARRSIVALTEDHCIPAPDWCAQVLAAHQAPHAAIGGAIEPAYGAAGEPGSALGLALYLCDWGRFLGPVRAGPASALSDCNVSYKRAALAAIADAWAIEFHEPAVHRALKARGEALWLSPEVVVHQHRSVPLGPTLRERYAFGRLFGATRLEAAPLPRRAFYAAAGVAIPPLVVARTLALAREKRQIGTAAVRLLPAIALVTGAWALGEAVGYLTGQPDSSLQPNRTPAAQPQPS